MLKTCFLLKRRPGMTRQEFIEYYETKHSKFISYMRGVRFYKRSYVKPLTPADGAGEDSPYDAVMHIWFEDRAAFDLSVARLQETGRYADIIEDEEKIFDRPEMIALEVFEESETDLSKVDFKNF